MLNGRGLLYFPTGERTTKIFIQGQLLGEVTKGSATLFFRTPDGRGRLFPSQDDFDRMLISCVQKYSCAVMN